MSTTHQRKLLSVITALGCLSFAVNAAVESLPVVGSVYNSAHVFKHQITNSVSYSTIVTRDTALFTIAGVTLDSYILALPLDVKTKTRVIAQISDPSYAIPLGYFLYQYYDRYSGMSEEDEFKQYVSKVYDHQTLKGFEHSLFALDKPLITQQNQHSKDQAHQEGIKVDSQFIATMVRLYDALVQIGEWRDLKQLPAQYQYLSDTPADQALVTKIQPQVMDILRQTANGMDEGEMKNALLSVLEDAKPENAEKVNNKAQAITVSLIDFVRLNVLKGYRQFLYQKERTERLQEWLTKQLSDNPQQVIAFLQSQQQRRLAVQITVDGLQQGLLEGLVDPKKPFIQVAYQQHLDAVKRNHSSHFAKPEHEQQVRFMHLLSEQPYHDPHYLPFFKQLYQNYRSSIVQVGISSTPTISVRNLPIIKTGAKVSGLGGTGIPNFHFVDRKEDRAYYFFGNDALQLDRLVNERGVKTMFDRLDYLKTLNCNAQYDWNAHVTYDGLVNLGAGETLRDFGEKRCLRELNERADVEQRLTTLRLNLIEQISAYQNTPKWALITRFTLKQRIEQQLEKYAKLDINGMPDYTLIYNPWPDHFAHFTGPFSDEVIMPTGELNRLDYWLRATEDAYQKAGVYDRTLWGMAGDHGLSPVYGSLNPEKQIFAPLQEQLGISIAVEKISSDEGEGPKLTNALNAPSYQAVDVLVASTAGGNFMLDFFNATAGWATQPVYKELIQWQPKGSDKVIDIVNESLIRLGETLDYLVVREGACTLEDCTVRVIGMREGKRVDELIRQSGNKRFYSAVQGKPQLLQLQQLNPYLPTPNATELDEFARLMDKCFYRAKESDVASWCDESEWRMLTSFTPRPDSVNQLAAIYEEERAGTINLFPREGLGYNTKVPGRHAGESYLEKDAFLGFWGKPVGRNAITLQSEQNGSLAPTLYEYLTGERVVVGNNGWGYPSLLNKLDIQ